MDDYPAKHGSPKLRLVLEVGLQIIDGCLAWRRGGPIIPILDDRQLQNGFQALADQASERGLVAGAAAMLFQSIEQPNGLLLDAVQKILIEEPDRIGDARIEKLPEDAGINQLLE